MLVEVLGEMQSVIGIWLSDKQTSYADACGVIPEVGLSSFWRALGVQEGFDVRLQAHMFEGATGPFAPGFPVLSELDQMHIDITWVEAGDIPAFLRELDIGRAACDDRWGQAVFDALKTCATLASARSVGIRLSPCW
jgi:hypothetical protein